MGEKLLAEYKVLLSLVALGAGIAYFRYHERSKPSSRADLALRLLPYYITMSAIESGFWINWEHGAVVGSTLTLPTYYGLILLSFLTLFIQFAGGCFW